MEEQTTIETLAPQRVPLGELEDGQRVRGAYAVRGRELRRKRNGEPWLKLTLGDASGTVEAVAWEEAEALYAIAAPGSCVFVAGCFETSERWGAKIKLTALRAANGRRVRRGRPRQRLRRPPRAARGRPARAARDRPERPAARAARPLLRRGLGDLGPLPRRAGGEGLPPGLPARAARAHALRRPGGLGRGQLLPRHRPRRRRRRRAAPRHRQDRGLQRRSAGDRPHRPRPPAGGDPARLLPGPPPDRGHPRLRPLPGPGGAAHHPQPPRLARARLPGRPLHARGRPRPHDRQPRRPPRQLRPPRARAARRRLLVGLRPRPLGLRLFRPTSRRPSRLSAPDRGRAAAPSRAPYFFAQYRTRFTLPVAFSMQIRSLSTSPCRFDCLSAWLSCFSTRLLTFSQGYVDLVEAAVLEGPLNRVVGFAADRLGRVEDRLDDEEIDRREDADRDQKADDPRGHVAEEVAQDVHDAGWRLSCDPWRRTPRS